MSLRVNNRQRLAKSLTLVVATLALTCMPAVAHGDRVVGNNGPNALSDTRRADVIRAKGGRDDIFMMHNRDRRRDQVNCGRGFDRVWVNFGRDRRGRVERRDVFRRCERIRAYSP